MGEHVQIGSIQGIFYSRERGQGKTVALHSYYRQALQADSKPTRRLSIDMEQRSRQYRSPDGEDHPKQLMWGFDYFHERYEKQLNDGELTAKALIQLYQDIRDGNFPYDAILVDNASMLQDDMRLLLIEGANAKNIAMALAKAFRGVYAKNQIFLTYKFKTTETPAIYGLLKNIIEELLRMCQKRAIDVLVATESKNVWKGYGTRDMKILGQTARLLEPWMKYADFAYRLSRMTGKREEGTAKLIAIPRASIDTFNPKNSLPGLPPQWEVTWDNFWALVLAREVTTQEQLDAVMVEAAESPEFDQTPEKALASAKKDLLEEATKSGRFNDADGKLDVQKVKDALTKAGLTPDDALAKRAQCLDVIRGTEGAGKLDFGEGE